MPFGMGPWGWGAAPYAYGYPYRFWWRCRWFPWLPRWWWTGLYGSMTPYTIPKEQEVAMLEDEAKMLEQALGEIRKRLEELKKTSG